MRTILHVGKSALLVVCFLVFASARSIMAQAIGDAVDAPDRIWLSGGANVWTGQTAVTHDGLDAGESGAIFDNDVSWFEASVTGPVYVTFWWKVDSEAFSDALKFIVDGSDRDEISGNHDWSQASYSIGAGPHVLRWSYNKDFSDSVGADRGWVDQIVIEAPQSLPLDEAVDATQLVWRTGGSVPWSGETLITHDAVDAVQTGTITNNMESWLETTVTGPVSVAFWWRVDSEEDFDFLTVSVDGFDLNAVSGASDWQYQSFTIGGGSHTMRWTYAKDAAGSTGADAGWVDEIRLLPIPLPATRFVWTNSPEPQSPYTNWQTAARSIQQAVDAARPGDIVLVTNGTYVSGVRALSSSTQRNRVLIDKPITVRSVNGPRFTSIVGSRDPLLSNGVKSVRCAYVTNGASLAGFTLTNGYSSFGGGGVFCEPGGIVSNSVFIGNNAIGSSGGGGLGGTYFNCVFWGNRAVTGGGVSSGLLQNCSLASNSAAFAGGTYQSSATNCIVYFNRATTNNDYFGGVFARSCLSPSPGGGANITNDPQFVGLSTGNLRLAASSPCLGAGTNEYWMTYSLDLDGNPRLSGGNVDMGAFERLVTGYDAWVMSIENGLTNYNQSAAGDGFPNLLKYATGSSPTNADGLAALSMDRSNTFFRLLFNRSTTATDVTYYIEAGASLSDGASWVGLATNRAGSWGASGNVVETGPGSPRSVAVSDPVGTVSNRFLRLRVTRP